MKIVILKIELKNIGFFLKVIVCWSLFLYLYIEILGLHVLHTSSPLYIEKSVHCLKVSYIKVYCCSSQVVLLQIKIWTMFFFFHCCEHTSVNTVQSDVKIFQNGKTHWTNSEHVEVSTKIFRMWCFPERKRKAKRNIRGVQTDHNVCTHQG